MQGFLGTSPGLADSAPPSKGESPTPPLREVPEGRRMFQKYPAFEPYSAIPLDFTPPSMLYYLVVKLGSLIRVLHSVEGGELIIFY